MRIIAPDTQVTYAIGGRFVNKISFKKSGMHPKVASVCSKTLSSELFIDNCELWL